MSAVQDQGLPLVRVWNSAAQDMALVGLKAELDGLSAMFALWSAAGVVPRAAREAAGWPVTGQDPRAELVDNLPI